MEIRKYAFVGYKNSFKYDKIGGTDSIVRRLTIFLSKNSKIYLFHYGTDKSQSIKISENIEEIHCETLIECLELLKKEQIFDTICIYLKPIDRLKLLYFRIRNSNLRFNTLITVFNENFIKRWILFLESGITYNGNIFCVSSRILNSINNISSRSVLLLPPVDDEFFEEEESKSNDKVKVVISYMGRLDYGKGADLAYSYFSESNLDPDRYEFRMYSYPWKNDNFSMDLHKKLLKQNKIKYIEPDLSSNPREVSKSIKQIIDNTDLFFLPYRYMRSTIDAPLVPMEIMSRNKPFLSTKLSGIKDLAYHSDALIDLSELGNVKFIEARILLLLSKRYSIKNFANNLNYKTSKVAEVIQDNLSVMK